MTVSNGTSTICLKKHSVSLFKRYTETPRPFRALYSGKMIRGYSPHLTDIAVANHHEADLIG
jgi:hypothetical protein